MLAIQINNTALNRSAAIDPHISSLAAPKISLRPPSSLRLPLRSWVFFRSAESELLAVRPFGLSILEMIATTISTTADFLWFCTSFAQKSGTLADGVRNRTCHHPKLVSW